MHVWPGVNHVNVWQMPLILWNRFAAAADAYEDSFADTEGKGPR